MKINKYFIQIEYRHNQSDSPDTFSGYAYGKDATEALCNYLTIIEDNDDCGTCYNLDNMEIDITHAETYDILSLLRKQ